MCGASLHVTQLSPGHMKLIHIFSMILELNSWEPGGDGDDRKQNHL